MEFKDLKVPEEFAVLQVDENEELLKGSEVTEEDKLVYVCRGQDD